MSTLIATGGGNDSRPRSLQFTRILPGALLTSAFAALGTEVIAWLGIGLFGANENFAPLAPGATAPATIVASLGAMLLYGLLQRTSDNPERVFIRISLAVLLLSFVPIAVLAFAPTLVPGTSGAALATLFIVHLVAYAVVMIGLVCTARAMEEGI